MLIARWSIQTTNPGKLSVFFLHQKHGSGLTFCFVLNRAYCPSQLFWLRACSSSKPKNVIVLCISSICDLLQWTRCDRPSVSHFPPSHLPQILDCIMERMTDPGQAVLFVWRLTALAASYALHCASQALLSSVSSLQEGERCLCGQLQGLYSFPVGTDTRPVKPHPERTSRANLDRKKNFVHIFYISLNITGLSSVMCTPFSDTL